MVYLPHAFCGGGGGDLVREKDRRALKAAFPLTLPVMAGYVILGIGFGLLLESRGYGLPWALLMSAAIYAGSMQYVAVDLLASGAGLVSAALMTLMVNARHLFYALAMLTKYRDMGKAKPYLVFALTDETFGLVSHTEPPEGVDRKRFYFYISLLDQSYWIAGSAIGSLFGALIPLNTAGVEFSMTALFLVIVTDNLLRAESRRQTALGIAASLLCLLLFGPDRFLIPAMALILIALLALRGRLDPEGKGEDA